MVKIGPTYDKNTKRWTNYYGQRLPFGLGYYSPAIEKFVQYNSDGTVTKFTPEEYAKKRLIDYYKHRENVQKQYMFDTSNKIKLTGTNTYIPSNAIDSIAKYSKILGMDKYDAFGLPNQESTFWSANGREKGFYVPEYDITKNNKKWLRKVENNKLVSPIIGLSGWSYFDDNPYVPYYQNSMKIANDKEFLEKERIARKKSKPINPWTIGINDFIKKDREYYFKQSNREIQYYLYYGIIKRILNLIILDKKIILHEYIIKV